MLQKIVLDPSKLIKLRSINPALVSYNVEMTEVTGGTFWKPYTKEQIDGTEKFPVMKDMSEIKNLMAWYNPIDLTDTSIRKYAKGLGKAIVRVSGSWASSTYYDFDGHTGGKAPEGFASVLTKEQWNGVLDFVKAVDAKLLISVANSEGAHNPDGSWDPAQTKILFDYSRDYGVPIYAAEFMNEPNTAAMGGAPKGYTAADYGRDQDLFYKYVRANYPNVKLVGPCATGDKMAQDGSRFAMTMIKTDELLKYIKEPADVFSYHYYNGLSERGAIMGGHWDINDALSEKYLSVAEDTCKFYVPMRDKHFPGCEMWVTESGDAGCGGNTWGSTYLDVIRYANELASFCKVTDGVIFHNTLCSSDYGLLDHATHEPRPNYWLAYTWTQLVGNIAYDTQTEVCEGAYIYAHSRKDGKEGYTYVVINNSKTDSTEIEIPCNSEIYMLSAEKLRSQKIMLNKKPMGLENNELPKLSGEKAIAGKLSLAPATVTFIVV